MNNFKTNFPEFDLLLSCCRITSKKIDRDRREQSFIKGIDEAKFMQLVKRHRIMEFVCLHLSKDSRLSHLLRAQINLQEQLNHRIAKEYIAVIHQLQGIFDQENLHACFIKGMPVGMEIYQGEIFRTGRDIDLWVDPKDFEKLLSMLQKMGFKTLVDFDKLNTKQKSHILSVSRDLNLYKVVQPGISIIVEIHTSIDNKTGRFTLDKSLRDYSFKKIDFYGTPVSVLGFEDHFLFLITHGAEHGWFRLKWLFDIVNGLERFNKEELQSLRQRAKTIGNINHLDQVLDLMDHYGFSNELPKRRSTKMNLDLLLHFINSTEQEVQSSVRHKFIYLFYQFQQIKSSRLKDRRLYMKFMTSKNDWDLVALPEKLFWLYYPLRPGFVLFRKLRRQSQNN
ncbi:hypothetical protein GCM10028791_44000 [Echinicola sediminis]